MGCLNSNSAFDHWFGNVHLSGPCNRSCYFCIGNHMMALDGLNNLNKWPLAGLDDFTTACKNRNIQEVNLTGTNTDPLMFRHHRRFVDYIRMNISDVVGIRTNGVLGMEMMDTLSLYDKVSISITSMDKEMYKQTMGGGTIPNIRAIKDRLRGLLKINTVLCKETVDSGDIFKTLDAFSEIGIEKVNLREPYGQPHIGNPLLFPVGYRYGMPMHKWNKMDVTYWDVHYVEVESVNLYASGRVSLDYPVTRGCSDDGKVFNQSHFTK